MLQISDIKKQYVTGELVQTALDGVNLSFRDSEFVAILGPSGSGKTTLLNIIGGLDRYDSGDLIINGISTKRYKSRDWDSYRNHTIGFVFQSYNLIPHQSVLSNVELALTISGISKKERRQRATEALEKVGLGDQLHKKPNQMSGGQMQRVAIARALVNNPDILLADEPTGALDTKTSIQVMELLKEVSKDRLVIMVTHNPELANEYASRIVSLKDGQITGDTNPFVAEMTSEAHHENMGKSSMSVLTALSLSFNNLKTKKGRTILTAFAGSIGIIGIALILSLSTGFQAYIDKIQEDTLSSYPLSIESETTDTTSLLAAFGTGMANIQEGDKNSDVIKEEKMMTGMLASMGSNDLKSFKKYLEDNEAEVSQYTTTIMYSYGISPTIYATDTDNGIQKINPGNLFSNMMGRGSMMSGIMGIFQRMLDNPELLESQYDVVAGHWPENYNDVILVLDGPNSLSDYVAYSLGLKDQEGLQEMLKKVMEGEEVEDTSEASSWTYDELLKLEFALVYNTDLYKYNSQYNVYEDMSKDEAFMKDLIASTDRIHIVGIVCPKEGASSTALQTGIAYTSDLVKHIINRSADTTIVKSQLANKNINVFNGKSFDEEEEDNAPALDFQDLISVDEDAIAKAFGGDFDQSALETTIASSITDISSKITADIQPAYEALDTALKDSAKDMLTSFIEDNTNEMGMFTMPATTSAIIVSTYMETEKMSQTISKLTKDYVIPEDVFKATFTGLLGGVAEGFAQSAGMLPPTLPAVMITPSLEPLMTAIFSQEMIIDAEKQMAQGMTEAVMQRDILTAVSTLSTDIITKMSAAFNVDASALANAFSFDLSEEELQRLMTAMTSTSTIASYDTNLLKLGYADFAQPTGISVYFNDFDSKQAFIDIIEDYNDQMEKDGKDDMIISYTDITGVLMSSVKTIVDSVSYVLIAFVAISLVVSSIMIGIITYISVLERTKEIGILRAIGASKRNISTVFNAETFMIGLLAGLFGVGISALLNFPINSVIYHVTNNPDIKATLPLVSAIILTVLSVVLTCIGGLLPSRKAAKQDPVIALRSE